MGHGARRGAFDDAGWQCGCCKCAGHNCQSIYSAHVFISGARAVRVPPACARLAVSVYTPTPFLTDQTSVKLKHQIKIAGWWMLFLVSTPPAGAQGVVHIGSGSSYLFSQPTFIGGKIDEAGLTSVVIDLGFTGDVLTAGESFQIDILSAPTSLTPLLTGTFSYPFGTHNQWLGVPWDAGNGAIRLTMLSGSVDVSSLTAKTASNNLERDYSYTIPEPSSSLLLLFSGAVPGGVRWIERRTKRAG